MGDATARNSERTEYLPYCHFSFTMALHSLVPKRHHKALTKPTEPPAPSESGIGVTNNGFGDNNFLHIGNVISLG